MRLTECGAVGMPELWVLRQDALAQIDSLVQNSDDQLIARLTFAVAERDGNTIVVLCVRPSKELAPVLVLNAQSFRPYLKLANLFVPFAFGLHPPLRRDAVAKLLVRDSTQPFLKVTVPKGTKLSDTLRLQPQLSDILGKLKGCLPCNSGVPIWFHEREEIENLVKIDLATMKRI